MVLQILGDLVHVGLHLAVLGLHGLQLIAGLFEQARQTLFLLLRAEALQLHHKAAQILADLAHILVADVGQRVFGKAGHAFLGRRAVLQHLIGVPHVDLLGKFVDSGFLLFRQHTVVQHHRLDLLLHLRGGRGGGRFRRQRQGGHLRRSGGIGGQCQFRHVGISHGF